MAITEYKTGSATIGTAEYSVVTPGTTLADDTTDGVFQAFLDPMNMAAGDQFRVRVYEKVTSGGSKRVVYESTLVGAQAEALAFPSLILLHGWDVTITKLAGTDRSFSWSIRQVA